MSLQNKTREELFQIWKKRLKIARDLHKEKVIDWADKVFKEYSGEAKTNQDTNERYSQMAQVIIAVEETVQPHLFFQLPRMTATAKAPQWEKRERLVEAVVNHEYQDIKPSGHTIELENELVILDARLLPFGVTKTTYEVEGEILEEPQDQGAMDKFKNMLTGGAPPMNETPVITKENGHVTNRSNPLKIFLDYSADHITKQKFVIEMMDVTKEDLNRPRYEQDKVMLLEPSSVLLPDYGTGKKVEKDKYKDDPDFKGFRIYEVHDLENKVIHTMSDGYEDFIEFNRPYPIPEGSQYSFCWFIEVPNQVYPAPPIKFYRQRASEFSYIYSQVSEQIDKFLPKIVIDINRLTKDAQDKYRISGLGAVIESEGPPSGAIEVVNPQVQPDLFKYMAMIKELMNLEAGVNDYETAVPEERKATEAKIIDSGTRARRFKPKKRVKGFIINQAHTIWQTLMVNVSEERFTKILGENDAMEWWEDPETGKNTWTKEDIEGDYWFDFDVESITPKDEQVRMVQNEKSMQTVLNPNLKMGLLQEGQELLLSGIFEKYAKENLGIKDKTRIMRPLNGLEPGDEHTLWMTGQYPQISEREQKDPEFMLKHVGAHELFINSPGFQSLPNELKQGAAMHLQSYQPLMQKLQAQRQPQGKAPQKTEQAPNEQNANLQAV